VFTFPISLVPSCLAVVVPGFSPALAFGSTLLPVLGARQRSNQAGYSSFRAKYAQPISPLPRYTLPDQRAKATSSSCKQEEI